MESTGVWYLPTSLFSQKERARQFCKNEQVRKYRTKTLLVLIYSKLHSKSFGYLYKFNE